MSNVRQPKCSDAVVFTDGEAIYPAFVNSQAVPPPAPTTAPADLLVFEIDGTITPRTAVPFDGSATPAPVTWQWKKDES